MRRRAGERLIRTASPCLKRTPRDGASLAIQYVYNVIIISKRATQRHWRDCSKQEQAKHKPASQHAKHENLRGRPASRLAKTAASREPNIMYEVT
eukprot:5611213-Heterocapsa_arctica.AAC.1